ncbi:formate dehydrogenase subunit gamma [Plastorhodobacter daqingensis]|uniref:Formate dehydrogenase subunit gamma n=1 Tax=Plastorhodobacter daqingensis TaxID=1387281 RepID=A0ABW2UPJ6_9RHOB
MTLKTLAARCLGLLAVVLLMAVSAPQLSAQQINPTQSSVQEQQLLEALQGGQNLSGRVTIPDQRAADLIKPGNPGWANLHGGTITTLFVVSVVGVLAALLLFYLIRGRIRVDSGLSGRMIPRFGGLERFAHWMLAASFIILALTGLNLVIGRAVIRPIIGEGAFGTMTAWGKLAHNYLAWPFMIALAIVFLVWVVHNIPNKVDLEWIKQGGGILKKGVHPPAKKFNFGQKMIFWAVVIGGAALSFTGVMLLFPHLAGTPADWQLYQVIHGVVAAILSAIIIAHIYIGSVGMEGAFDAMGKGEVDLNWAKEHHSLWVDEMMAKDTKPQTRAGTVGTPAE